MSETRTGVRMTSTTNLSKPTLDTALDTCQYNSCDNAPTMTIRFRNPNEYICYCRDHADEQFSERTRAKYRSKLA